MVRFALLKCEFEDAILPYIKSQLLGKHLNLNDINQMQIKNQEGFIISKFVSEVTPSYDCAVGTDLHCKFSENNVEFTVVFQNRLAEEIKKLILLERISVGDFVSLYGPKVFAYKDNSSKHMELTCLNMDDAENQQVIIWKNSSLHYVEPFLTHINQYKHIEFYEMDHTGSKDHVLSNLRSLVVAHGPVIKLTLPAGTNHRCVALARFTHLVCSSLLSTTRKKTDHVLVKFSETKFECNVLSDNSFCARFIGELAGEIESAVNESHIESNDLVAFIFPRFKWKTASYININFPTEKQVNWIVLKNQYCNREICTKICFSDINPTYRNIQMCAGSTEDYFPLEFYNIVNGSNEKIVLSKICKKLDSLGTTSTTANIIGLSEKEQENMFILSYFLKLMREPKRTLTETGGSSKIIVLLREISPDCYYSFYIKLVLHCKFADTFYRAVKSKAIVRGDVICLKKPVILEGNQSEYENELSYVVDIFNPEEQAILVFRIGQSDKFEESTQAPQVQRFKDMCCLTHEQKYSSNECIKKISDVEPNLTDILVTNNENLERTGIINIQECHRINSSLLLHNAAEESKANMPSKCKDQVYKPKSTESCKCKPSMITCTNLANTESIIKSDIIPNNNCSFKRNLFDKITPIMLIKPALNHSMDLISGYCKYGCNLMFPYSSVVNTCSQDNSKPLCLKCSTVLELNFCLEMLAVARDGLLKVLLYGADAEKFLNTTCIEFLAYDDTYRKLIVELLNNKLHFNLTGQGQAIEWKDVTFIVNKC